MSEVVALTRPVSMGGVAHARAVVTNTPGTLASFISGGIPTMSVPNSPGSNLTLQPYAVELSIETGSAANAVYWAIDNPYASNTGFTVSATLGYEVSKQPVGTWLSPGGDMSTLKLVGSAASVYVQCLFYYGR